jgi:hypothetical protein
MMERFDGHPNKSIQSSRSRSKGSLVIANGAVDLVSGQIDLDFVHADSGVALTNDLGNLPADYAQASAAVSFEVADMHAVNPMLHCFFFH